MSQVQEATWKGWTRLNLSNRLKSGSSPKFFSDEYCLIKTWMSRKSAAKVNIQVSKWFTHRRWNLTLLFALLQTALRYTENNLRPILLAVLVGHRSPSFIYYTDYPSVTQELSTHHVIIFIQITCFNLLITSMAWDIFNCFWISRKTLLIPISTFEKSLASVKII